MSSQVSTTKKLLSASVLMASGTLISRILGFVRVAMIAFILGNATRQADMLNLATSVPNSLYILFAGGALNTVLVPQIVRAIKNDADGGEAYTNRIMTAFIAILAAVAVLVTVGAPVVTGLYANEYRTDALLPQFESIVALAYLTLPQVFFYGVFFLLGQVLNARDRFGPMMWAPIANNIIAIAVLCIYLIVWGTGSPEAHAGAFTSGQVWLLGIGTTVGIAAQTVVLIPYLRHVGFKFRPRFDLKGTGLGKTFSLTKWTMGFVAVNQLALVVTTNINTSATALVAGGAAGLAVFANAYLVWILPHSLITVSLATAMLPNASRLAAQDDMPAVAAEAIKTMRLALVALVPATVGFIALSSPIAALLFGNGSGSRDSQFVAVALAALAVGLIPFTVQFVCLRTYYALENTRTPFFLQCAITVVNIASALLLVWWIGDPQFFAAAVALSHSLAYLVGVIISWRFLKRAIPAIDGLALSLHIARLALGAGVGGVLAYFASNSITAALQNKFGVLLAVLAGLAIIGATTILISKLLRVRELASLTSLLRTRFGRRSNTVAEESVFLTTPQPAASSGAEGQNLLPTQLQGAIHAEDESAAEPFDPEEDVETRIRPAIVIEDEDRDDEGDPTTEGGTAADAPDPVDAEVEGNHSMPVLGEAGQLLSTRYRLEEPLVVRHGIESWRAHDLQLSRDVVAHVMPEGDERIPHVLDAARTGASATDSRFLRVLDAVTLNDGGAVGGYVICEYAPGTALSELISTQQLTSVEAAWIVLELADALAPMHAQGLFHEQLTPDNVILTTTGSVRIVGFGVESVLAAQDRPLSWSDKEAADVTALGRLLYAMLCRFWPGRAAWGLSLAPIVAGSLAGPSRLRGAVPPALDKICTSILAMQMHSAGERITTVSQLMSRLAPEVGGADPSRALEERIRHVVPGRTVDELPRPAAPLAVTPAPMIRRPLPAAPMQAATEQNDAHTYAEPSVVEDDEVSAPSRKKKPLLWTIVLLVIVALLAAFILSRFRNDEQNAATPTTSTEASPEQSGEPFTIVTSFDFDPEADGGNAEENPAQVKNAFDGDPATGWSTVQYHNRPNMGGLKPGVGIVMDLGEMRDISSVEVQFSQPGTTVELRVPTDDSVTAAPMTTQAEWTVVATQADAAVDTALVPETPTNARFLLVYVSVLPEITTARFLSEITEITVS